MHFLACQISAKTSVSFTKERRSGGADPEAAVIVCHWEPKDESIILFVFILNVRMVSS